LASLAQSIPHTRSYQTHRTQDTVLRYPKRLVASCIHSLHRTHFGMDLCMMALRMALVLVPHKRQLVAVYYPECIQSVEESLVDSLGAASSPLVDRLVAESYSLARELALEFLALSKSLALVS